MSIFDKVIWLLYVVISKVVSNIFLFPSHLTGEPESSLPPVLLPAQVEIHSQELVLGAEVCLPEESAARVSLRASGG